MEKGGHSYIIFSLKFLHVSKIIMPGQDPKQKSVEQTNRGKRAE